MFYMFWVGNNIFDQYVVSGSFNVNQYDEYGNTEYVDGWWKKHRTISRTRISGTLRLAFTPAEFNDFLTKMEQAKGVEGDYSVYVYVINLNNTALINAYVNYTARAAFKTKNFDGSPVYFNVDVTIEER